MLPSVIASAVVCPVVNTGIFALRMLLIFGKPLMEDPDFSALSGGSLVALVFVVLIGVNFFVELALPCYQQSLVYDETR